jgi:uncharacterized protein
MLLKIQVKPNSKKTEIIVETSDFIKIAINSPAQEGKANAELIKFLKKEKGWNCRILKGKTSKTKLVQIINE